jgi:hypothetical protein
MYAGDTSLQAKDVTVMISGGFKAALEKLTPQFEAKSGNTIILVSGPFTGKSPQAIPSRLAHSEKADGLRSKPKVTVLNQSTKGINIVEIKINGHNDRQSFQRRQRLKREVIVTYSTTTFLTRPNNSLS